MTASGFFVDWGSRHMDGTGVELRRLPDKILEEIPLVLGQQQVF